MSSELRRHHPRIAHRLVVRCRLATLVLMAALSVGAATACSGGLPSPTSERNSGQAVMDLGTLVGEFRDEHSLILAQRDLRRGAVVYQDTILRQLAAGAGGPMRSLAVPPP